MCPSEVSDIDRTVWQTYQDQGLVVWAIASEENHPDAARHFAEALDLTMPVLYDEGGIVHADYVTVATVPSAAYPEEWIVDAEGTVVYHAAEYDHGAVVETIEALLQP